MAENESLDLNLPSARRWKPALEAALRGESCQKVSSLTRKALLGSIKKAMKQFAECGVLVADFLDNRGSHRAIQKLVNRTLNHSFAEQLASVLNSNPYASNTDCVNQWEHAILDRIFDQFEMKLVGGSQFPSFYDADSFLRDVRGELLEDLENVAINIVNDPQWKPSVRSKKGEARSDPTADLLSMSLVGGLTP